MLTMIGTLMSARSTAPLKTLSPTAAEVYFWIRGFMTEMPMNPHTTEGIAASSSMTILSVSLTRLLQYSERNTAAPMPNGIAISMANTVTLPVPTRSANTP